jgi:hypothetical protein
MMKAIEICGFAHVQALPLNATTNIPVLLMFGNSFY